MARALLAVGFCLFFANAECSPLPLKLGSFNVKYPGFLALHQNTSALGTLGEWDLLISSFDATPFSTDSVYIVLGVAQFLKNPSVAQVETVSTDVVWPNEVQSVPDFVFNRQMVLAPNGFLVPFKTKGSLELFDISQTPYLGPYKITAERSDDELWFYHRVVWKDMNNDGLLDAVTCRAVKPIFGTQRGQLLWLERPNGTAPYTQQPWTEHVISEDGPDIFLRSAQLDIDPYGNKVDSILTAGFFSNNLSIYWTMSGENDWNDMGQVHSRTISDSYGHFFDVMQVDLNGDGTKDLLVTNNDAENGVVLAFEIPEDFRNGTFAVHQLLGGLRPAKMGTGKGAPGSAMAFYPQSREATGKPLIALSGDDDGRAYILSPRSTDPSDWTYEVNILQNATPGTIGELAIGDVDGDGYNEIFVPAYDENTVTVYTYGTGYQQYAPEY